MTTWKLLLLVAVLALPLGYVVADVGEGADDPAPREAVVLPAGATGDTSPGPGRGSRTPEPGPSPTAGGAENLCDGDQDDDRGDDDDDGIDVVRPCPDDVGDDDDDDDRDEADDRDDG